MDGDHIAILFTLNAATFFAGYTTAYIVVSVRCERRHHVEHPPELGATRQTQEPPE